VISVSVGQLGVFSVMNLLVNVHAMVVMAAPVLIVKDLKTRQEDFSATDAKLIMIQRPHLVIRIVPIVHTFRVMQVVIILIVKEF
jgi:hypothetical protein